MKIRLPLKLLCTTLMFAALVTNPAMASSLITCDLKLEDVRYQPRNGHVISFVRPAVSGAGPNGVLVFCETDPADPDLRAISPKSCEHIFDMLVSAKIAEHAVTLVIETDDATIFSNPNERVCANLAPWSLLENSLSSVYLGQPL